MVIFDLDSTLFDVRPRIKKVLEHFAESEGSASHPEWRQALKKAEVEPGDWGIRPALERLQVPLELALRARDFWKIHFFSSDFLHFDDLVPGALDFALHVNRQGHDIVYLTGRDVHRMERGSREVLKKFGFPLEPIRAELVLKPEKGLDDSVFKSSWFGGLSSKDRSRTWFFDNEPWILQEVERQFPEVNLVFLDTTHSGRSKPSPHWRRIYNFLPREGWRP